MDFVSNLSGKTLLIHLQNTLEDIKSSSCCYRVEKIGSSPYEPKEFYKIIFWEEDDIEVAVV